MTPVAKARLQAHACVVLWGFTAILGKLIRLAPVALVWWRMVMVVGALLVLPQVRRGLRALPLRLVLAYAGVGLVVTVHWVTFYGAIKLANASVAATCIALAPVFIAIIEPWVARRRFDARELLLGVAVVPGVALVVGGLPAGMRAGMALGVASAALVALFGTLNKRLVHAAHPLTITCVELSAGVSFIALLAPWGLSDKPLLPLPDRHDAILIAVLATACTLLPFTMSLWALRHLTAYEAQLVVNLEPVYSIVLAVVLLGEQRELGAPFYAGVAIILGAVFAYPALRGRPARGAAAR